MHLEVIDEEVRFVELKPEWDVLLASSRQNGPFLTHDWLNAWWQTHEPRGRLHVLAWRDESGRLVGVMPTFSASGGRLVPVRMGRMLGDRGVGSTGLSPFARPEFEDEVFARLCEYFADSSHRWDVADLDFLDTSQPFFSKISAARGATVGATSGVSPQIDLPSDWDRFLAGLSRNRRYKLGRWQRQAVEHGAELEIVQDPAALPEAVEDLLRLHEQRMKMKAGEQFVVSPEYGDFTRMITRTLLDAGSLRLMFLRRGAERLAVLYMFRHEETMYAQQCAFVPSEEVPNLVRPLIAHGLKQAIAEGCATFDMLLGDQAYKFEWGVTRVSEFSRVRVYGRTLAARARRRRDELASAQRQRSSATEVSS